MGFTRRNHYVPSVYVKHFANARGETSMYRLLVSRPQVPLWKPIHISAVGYHRDLYTRLVLGGETDEFDAWLSKEFETPADPVLTKVHANEEISSADFEVLVRFLACQIVRVPAFFVNMLPIWNRTLPEIMEQVNADARAALIWSTVTGKPPAATPETPRLKNVPMRVRQENSPEDNSVRIVTELVVGRGLWLSTMEMLLTYSIRHLEGHHWSIFHAAPGLTFFTSDDPVLRVNYRGPSSYDFNGGWGSPGTEILLPLSPHHLLYAKVGTSYPSRGLILTESETNGFRKMIAEHAHRYIFAPTPDPEVPTLRPRKVDAAQVEHERREWAKWHADQVDAESKISANGAHASQN